MNFIETHNLIKDYKNDFRLEIRDLSIDQGGVIGFIGNNGAGKTTFFRLLLDLIRPDSGEVCIKGRNVKQDNDWRRFTTCFLEEGFLMDYLTVAEFLSFKASLYRMSQTDFKSSLNYWLQLLETGTEDKRIRDLSTGNRQKVGIISAAMMAPDLLVLDEPFNYLDPTSQIRMMRMLKDLNSKNGTTILLSSHNLEYVSELSSRVLVLEKGQIIEDYNTREVDVKSRLENYFKAQITG